MRPLAVLRPEPAASATIALASSLGLPAFSLPLFVIEPMAWAVPDARLFDGLLLTSANAVRQSGPELKKLVGLPAHAVGPTTGAAATSAGLTVRTVGEGGVERLLGSLPANLRLLHLCGEDRHVPADALQELIPLPVYRAVAVPAPPGLERLDGAVALVHSPRAGQRLAGLMARRGRTSVAAISPAAARACGDGWQSLAVAERPDERALLSLAAQLCKEPQA